VDLTTIRTLLDSVLDAGAGDSKAVMKPFFVGPLQYAVAAEVVAVLKEVYQESTGGSHPAGGVAPFAGPAALGTRQPAVDAVGRPRPVTLTLAADDRTNTVVGMATELMAADIAGVVRLLEERAERSRKVVQLVPTVGIDPALVQEVLDAIQGRTPTPQRDHDDAGGLGAGPLPFGPPAGAGAARSGGTRGGGRGPGG
jgi:hypothetical protein